MTFQGVVRRGAVVGLLLLGSCIGGMPRASAADLTMGIGVEPDSIDPHFHWFGGNLHMSFQLFEPLVGMSGDGTLQPVLASSWKALNDTTWEFILRPGAKFQDGTPLTSADVAFTFKRAPDVPQSPAGFGPYLRHITSVETPEPGRLIIHTDGPVPLLPTYLTRILIVSEHAGKDATTQDYNSGKAAIGTGPYSFVSWAHGDSIRLKRNPGYWGKAPDWDNVRVRYIPNAAAREAAMLSGDVDIIDGVSVDDVGRLKQNAALHLADSLSNNMVALQIDVVQRKPPYITANDGKPLDKNPLADVRVRRALAMAVNRDVLKTRVMSDEMATTEQLMAKGQFGFDPDLKGIPYDPAGAKKLLAEAGYPDGFKMTMQCQSDRYPNGPQFCQAVASMFIRIGIRTEPVPVPHNVYVPQANANDYSMFDTFMLMDTFEPSQAMVLTFATKTPSKGWGEFNRGRYSNPDLDQLLDKAAHQVDPIQREATLRQAQAIVINDVAVVPLLRPLNIEAMRTALVHAPRADGFVFAADVHPAAKAAP